MRIRAKRSALFGALAAAVLIAAIAAATGGGTTEAKAAPAAQEVAGSITLAGWTSGGSTEGVLLRQVLANFRKKYPRIRVTYTALDPYQQNMLAQFAARRPPDVFYVDSNDFPDWAKVLAQLNPLHHLDMLVRDCVIYGWDGWVDWARLGALLAFGLAMWRLAIYAMTRKLVD